MPQTFQVETDVRAGVEVYVLRAGEEARAEIAPALGNNCFAFHQRTDVLEPVAFADFRQRPTSYGIPLLFPFPNRIRDGRFSFAGQQYQVEPPRHGFVRDKPWQVVAHGASAEAGAWLTAAFDTADYADTILKQFPFPFRLEVTHRLRAESLELVAVIHNTGPQALPYGYGVHPYFRRPAQGTLTVPAAQRWALADSLPTGELVAVTGQYDLRQAAPVSGLQLDDIFTALTTTTADGLVRCTLADETSGTRLGVEFAAQDFPHVVVYTPPAPRVALCVEPNTCPTDAFNLAARGVESNVLVLPAGASREFKIRFAESSVA